MKKTLGLCIGLWITAGGVQAQQKLSLVDYLAQVKAQGPDYRSAQASVVGLEKQSHMMDLTYSPTLLASYNHLNDLEPQSTILAAQQTQVDSAGASITVLLPFGPRVSMGYAFNNINITYPQDLLNAFNSFAPGGFLSSYYQVSPVISLSVPLFKDFGGAQTSAGVHMVQYQLESAQKGAAFMREQSLFKAKVAYWTLALEQTETAIRQDTLDRSQKIWEWTKRRVARNLADPPDALQAEAAVRVAELDLQMAQERERTARLDFNRYRNMDATEVPESLENLEDSMAGTKVDIPASVEDRLDLESAVKTSQSQKAAYDQAYQNIYPDITAYASWRGNGLDPDLESANDTAFGNSRPTFNIGAQFTLPLDLFTASRVAEGYKSNYESALLTLKDKKIEVSQQWKDLKDRLQDVDKRLAMATQIEDIQKNKADQEKTRLELGRTTQFQLLSFENDYSLARLNRLSLILEKLTYMAQAQWWLSTE